MNTIEQYLVRKLDNIDLIVEQVIFLLPDSYFYKPEINQGELMELRYDLDSYRAKLNFWAFKNDRGIQHRYAEALAKYNEQLSILASEKRKVLNDELLQETLEVKCACMMNLIRQYRLLKRLRTYY
ncbi:hypothetical protein ACTGUR_10900 [Streptococcus suis]|uniref:hypothetical protein n=1 Tax=Streptococcus suis TaxID=1307 RepID=UPI0037D1A25B